MSLSPTLQSDRIQSLDVLRGFAILGILLMNIQAFSMIGQAYSNPTAYGDLSGINLVVWIFSHVFADEKFMGIFSLLFGAGVLLFIERADAKGKPTAKYHYLRNFYLLLIGLAHAYLFWYGDILTIYAICAFWLYLWRKAPPRSLIIASILCLLVPVFLMLAIGISMPYIPAEAIAEMRSGWQPNDAQIQAELDAYRSGWISQIPYRAHFTFFVFHLGILPKFFLWRVGGMMLLGMALYKQGILTGKRSPSYYKKLTFWGIGLGLPLIAYGVYFNFEHQWQLEYSMFLGSQFNYIGSIGLCLGYIGLILLWVKSDFWQSFQARLAATGRMALTNYLSQTFIAGLIFYGHGLGLYGSVERGYQFLIVLGIWALQLWWSPWWLARFKFGPFEWIWRSMTYGKWQTIR